MGVRVARGGIEVLLQQVAGRKRFAYRAAAVGVGPTPPVTPPNFVFELLRSRVRRLARTTVYYGLAIAVVAGCGLRLKCPARGAFGIPSGASARQWALLSAPYPLAAVLRR